VIAKVFATPKSIQDGPSLCNTQIYSVYYGASIFSKRKQLYGERIDDHIKKSLNRQTERCASNSFFPTYKFSLKTVAFIHNYKPFAVCIAQHFPHALRWSYYP
jgi:hypothetical protein